MSFKWHVTFGATWSLAVGWTNQDNRWTNPSVKNKRSQLRRSTCFRALICVLQTLRLSSKRQRNLWKLIWCVVLKWIFTVGGEACIKGYALSGRRFVIWSVYPLCSANLSLFQWGSLKVRGGGDGTNSQRDIYSVRRLLAVLAKSR